jgi:eukaryotic-like serine/threonine-protein kinase
MQLELVIVAGPEQGRKLTLQDGQTLVIGRGQASDTQINDPRMSRVHCRVQVDGGKVTLIDAGGASGTLLDNAKITAPVELAPGQAFQVGDTLIRFGLDAGTDSATVVGDAALGAPKPVGSTARLQELVGKTFATYRLDEIITHGNSGMVFKGHDTEKDRPCAVKVLTPDLANSDEQKERFVRAMMTMMPIRHPNLVRLYNAGKKGPYCWVAMEYIDGESLTKVIDRIGIEGMIDWREAWRVAIHVTRALVEASSHQIIHRNVTPENIIRRHSDKATLLGDLILAKALEGTQAKEITAPGQLIGDVPYMSPERTRDSSLADTRSDIYGLGATLYALLAGKPPFESDSLVMLVSKVREETPVPPREFQMSINENFEDLVLRMLAKSATDRPQNAAELLVELERIGRFNNLDAD